MGQVYGRRRNALECPWLPQCFGGCRIMWILREGKMNRVDCWKSLRDATIEICVLRDLKYRPQTLHATAENAV